MRHFLIWCLALLLPLQGLAASTGLHCVSMAAVVVLATHTGMAAHPCHESAGAAGASASTSTGSGTAAVSPEAPVVVDDLAASGHTCSACAACCMAAALPSHSRWTAATAVAEAMPVLPLLHRADITGAGLERPPKAFIA